MKLNFNFSGKTLLKDWWKTVRDNFTTIQTDHNTLSDKLDTEITQRTNADVGLSDQITAEKKARESTDNTLQGNIDAEAKNRRVGDSELREQILTEQTNRTNADDILNGEKADKTDLYGKETDVVHTITHSLEKSDLSIDINTSYGDGTITINSLAVQTKIFLDGNSAIQTEPISASFSAEKGEEGEKWVNLLYDQYTGKLGLEVTEQPEAGNVAKIAVTYMKAEVAEMYAGQLKFDGIKDLRALKTDNKNSFLAAVNEIATKLTTEISDREDVEYSLTEKIITEISDRQAADNELKAKISDINTELTTDNLFYDLSKYVNSDNTLVTDDSGVQYLSYSGSFENGTYLYHNFVVDNFHRKPKTETTLELTFNVASRHIAGDGCDIGGLNIGETDVLITYTDTTTETFGQSYYTATDTGDKTITINGTSETYKTTKFKIEIPVKKEIKSISFRIVSDNFYTNGDPTGNACKQKTLIQSAVCYDDECVAVLRDDINANTSKITANTTKLTTEISDRQAADDELKAKFTDLKTVAFTGSYTDLSNKPTTATTSTSGFMSAADKTKLNGIATGANNYTHPSTHPASMIVQDSTHRFVSDNEISDWDNKLDANFVSNGYAGIDEVTTTLSDLWTERVAPPTTITIACSTSKHKNTADYHCNGTNDQTVIQQAIDALPSTGGKIVLLEGTYNISGQINVNKPNVTICGMGNNTILKAAKSSSTLTMLRCSTHSGFKISNLVMDFENNSSADCIGIQLYVSGHSTIENISILNNKGNGIEWYKCDYTRFNGVSFVNVRQCIWDRGYNHSSIFSGVIIDTATNGIVLETNSELNQIDGCIVRYATGKGISSDSAYTMINDNIVYGCGVGITANGNCSTVSDNNACDNDTGISINGKMINVSGNTAVRTDGSGNVSSYSSSQYTILLGSSSANCLVIGNIIIGKKYTNNGNSTHIIVNNKY